MCCLAGILANIYIRQYACFLRLRAVAFAVDKWRLRNIYPCLRLDDGGETDLDLGNYERMMYLSLGRHCFICTFWEVNSQ